jgi:hypothetical protein
VLLLSILELFLRRYRSTLFSASCAEAEIAKAIKYHLLIVDEQRVVFAGLWEGSWHVSSAFGTSSAADTKVIFVFFSTSL